MLDTKLIISETINLIPFALFILLIVKQNNKPSISIRSPKLLISENIGVYLISAIFIFSYFTPYNNLNKILYSFYYVSQGITIISFYMRCQRILFCYKVKYDDKDDLNMFKKKQFYYSENYYFLLMILFLGIFLIFFLVYSLTNDDAITIPFIEDEKKQNQIDIYCWLILNFIEMLILITFIYRFIINTVQFNLIFEIISFSILWFFYFNLIYFPKMKILDIVVFKENKHILIIISLIFLYLNLILTGYFPIILSYYQKTVINYFLQKDCLNNLYLFLCNEECYNIFYNYLYKKRPEDIFYLDLYSHIMLYRFHFTNEENELTQINEGHLIYNKYFSNDLNFDKFSEIIDEIKSNFDKGININMETFDPALSLTYNKLGDDFILFKKSIFFDNLKDKIGIRANIYCKMINLGLIEKV
jgi:hypothetical protein